METKKKLHSNPCSVLHDKSAGAIFPLSKFTSLYKGPLRPAVEQPHNLFHFIARIQQMHHFRCRMDVNDRRKRDTERVLFQFTFDFSSQNLFVFMKEVIAYKIWSTCSKRPPQVNIHVFRLTPILTTIYHYKIKTIWRIGLHH